MVGSRLGVGVLAGVLSVLSVGSPGWAQSVSVAVPEQMTLYLREGNRPSKGLTLIRLDSEQRQVVFVQGGKEYRRDIAEVSKLILYGKTVITGGIEIVVQGDSGGKCGSETKVARGIGSICQLSRAGRLW